jgi:hypothetical protein
MENTRANGLGLRSKKGVERDAISYFFNNQMFTISKHFF